MNLQEFANLHLPVLEADEVRFNVQIAVLTAAAKNPPAGFQYWSLGASGHCAIQSPERSILLCALDRDECRQLARETSNAAYPGVMGSDETANWFVEEAVSAGVIFGKMTSMRIHVLTDRPRYPNTEGSPRAVTEGDAQLLFEWMLEFRREAVPNAPPVRREDIEKGACSGRYLFWTVRDRPVSVAAITRRLPSVAAIGAVYTPPDQRSRGYAGSATAALSDRIFAEGRRSACLYTDLSNPYSNRCYQKIGFKPYCDSWDFKRAVSQA